MTRFTNISLCILMAVVFSSCQTIQFDRPTFTTEKDWLVDGYSQNRSRTVDFELNLPMSQVWEYNAAAGFGPGSPLVLDDVVLVATRKGEIHSIELETGRKLGFKSFGEGIEGSPVIADGQLFVASALGKHILLSFDLKRGSNIWRNRGVPIESGIVVAEGKVVAANVYGAVNAYESSSGADVWSTDVGSRVSVQSSLLLTDPQSVFVADDSGGASLLSLDDGSIKWRTQLSGPVYEGSSAMGGLVVVPTTRGTVEALDLRSGRILWTHSTELKTVRFGSTAVAEDVTVVGATDGMVRALDPKSGRLIWSASLPDVISAAPLITQSHIFVGTLGRKLYALNRESGEIEWETTMKGRIKSSMAVVEGGLLVLSEPRYVTYFKLDEGGNDESN